MGRGDFNSPNSTIPRKMVLLGVVLGVAVVSRMAESLPFVGKEGKCPVVKPRQQFDIFGILGKWYVLQYYSSEEETLTYNCMRAVFQLSPSRMDMWMDFTYAYADDPAKERLTGNITWQIPDPMQPAHWVHAEDHYEGVYNTYVLDSEDGWALLLHCAEKLASPKYLSSFVMSRKPQLDQKVVEYLRHKLPKYDIDLEYMFPVRQRNCSWHAPPSVILIDSKDDGN